MVVRMIDGGWYRARMGNAWAMAPTFADAVARCILVAMATALVHCTGGE